MSNGGPMVWTSCNLTHHQVANHCAILAVLVRPGLGLFFFFLFFFPPAFLSSAWDSSSLSIFFHLAGFPSVWEWLWETSSRHRHSPHQLISSAPVFKLPVFSQYPSSSQLLNCLSSEYIHLECWQPTVSRSHALSLCYNNSTEPATWPLHLLPPERKDHLQLVLLQSSESSFNKIIYLYPSHVHGPTCLFALQVSWFHEARKTHQL